MMRILFTGVGRRIELIQAFREAALVLHKELKIYGADLTGTAPALIYCDYIRKVLPMKDPGYIDNLLSICQTDRIDLVIPTIDTDLLVLSENKVKFDNIGTKVMISSSDMIRVCRDKNLTSQFFVNCGLCAPMPVNDWRKYENGYPAFIKPKDGSSSINAYKVDCENDLKLYASQIDDYIVQPYISGREYTIDIFCDWDGNPISVVPRERLQVRAGEVLKTQICMDQIMIDEARKLCEEFKPCGPMTVQLIRDEDGKDWFIEINPRFGGGAPLSMKAGARNAESILKLLDNEELHCFSDIEDGAIYSRFDQSVCIKAGKSSVHGVIFDLDDTLYSEKEYVKSGYKVVSDYLGGGFEDQLWNYFEDKKQAIDELLMELGKIELKDDVLDIYRNHKPDIHLYPGVKEMIDELKSRKIRVGIITDGRPVGQHNKIEALGLNSMIDDIIITDELGGIQFRKPCDIAFRILQNRWSLPYSHIVYVGDNANKDFGAPQQLGMKFLCYENPDGIYSSNEGKADRFSQLSDLIDKLGIKNEDTNIS